VLLGSKAERVGCLSDNGASEEMEKRIQRTDTEGWIQNYLRYILLSYALLTILVPSLSAQYLDWIGGHVTPLKINCFIKDKIGNIYAATGSGVYRSIDHGNRWKQVGLPGGNIWPLCIDSSNHVFAGAGKIFLSNDSAKTWQEEQVFFQCMSTDKFGAIYGWGGDNNSELWNSIDGGSNWKEITTSEGKILMVADTFGNLFGAGNPDGFPYVWTSSDKGSTWIPRKFNTNWHQDWSVTALYVSKSNTLYVGTLNGQIYTSSDTGTTWKNIRGGGEGIWSILADDNDKSILATGDTRLIKSFDGGHSWSQDTEAVWPYNSFNYWDGLPCLIQDTGKLVHIGTPDKGIWDSYDFGHTWEQHLSGASKITSYCLNQDRSDSMLLMGTSDGIFYSMNRGGIWQKLSPSMDSQAVHSIEVPEHKTYVIAFEDRILRSSDGGNNWIVALEDSGQILHLTYDNTTSVLFAYDSLGRIYKSSNKGINWNFLGQPIATGDSLTTVRAIGKILIGTAHGFIFQSIDTGIAWTQIGGLLPSRILNINFDSASTYAATDEGLFQLDSIQHSWLLPKHWPINRGAQWILRNSRGEWIALTDYGELIATSDRQIWYNIQSGLQWFEDMKVFDDIVYALTENAKLCIGTALLKSTVLYSDELENFTANPNPFSKLTTFVVTTKNSKPITLEIFNILGSRKAIIANKEIISGSRSFSFDASDLPAGSYFVRLICEAQIKTMMIIVEK